MRTFGFITVGVFVLAWLFFPNLFQWWAIHVWSIPADQLDEMGKLGPLGDIYGSLNTLFTSVTLIIVIYSAYLQRQANKDAREAMAEQLKQARDATAKQLRQARQSTEQQLQLARESHKAQIAESKYAVFSSMFNILLSEKNKNLERLSISLGDVEVVDLFQKLSETFEDNISHSWKDYKIDKDNNDAFLYGELRDTISKNFFGNNIISSFNTYFYYYMSLIGLIKESELKPKDKEFFYYFLSNTMTHHEQTTLLWFSACSIGVKIALRDTGILDTGFSENTFYFITKNFDKSMFSHSFILEKWNSTIEKETPA
ncbi:hypothetical protein J8Z71_16445 [Acinetobacter nosocomialis]|uniref:hypothetical protein n=1 Tax=Acinetobacter nosocomialis TaxID=106654 RepID=UPI001AE84B95|nr:hypothetical protein [Acinetobacter nosocomialis]MBP1488898.1 hypothetical protein [Acinetobacter nosocomialis]